MAKYFRYFETIAQFESAYTGEEYVEPFVAYVEESGGVAFDKPSLYGLTFKKLRMVGDVPASGGTVTEANCTYSVWAAYSDGTKVDITEDATVSGSLVIASSQVEQRHSAGTLTLTAEYSGVSGMGEVVVYQAAFIPSVTGITLDDLTWETDVPYSGGVATKDNCSYTVTAYYDNGVECGVTQYATVIGSATVESTMIEERHSAGTLTLTAEYSGFTDSNSVTIYQEGNSGYITRPFTFNILSGGQIAYGLEAEDDLPDQPQINPIQYKVNDGEWVTFVPSTDNPYVLISANTGDVIQFKGDNDTYSYDDGKYYYQYKFGSLEDTYFEIEGNIMSLINSSDFSNETELTEPSALSGLFVGSTGLISAENLVLPATALTGYCYASMFWNCTNLTTAPETLPATTLANSCYYSMFSNCTSLTTAPALPATTLAEECYGEMFGDCTSLTTAPELPATTLTQGCYNSMFTGCTSLTTAPELPATTLAESCYSYMFNGCTSLNYIKCLATDISASDCTSYWVNGVASSGTFVKNPNMSSWTTGYNGIPSNWTVQDAS